MSDPNQDDSAVLAYRVGQLEKAMVEGLQRLETKIDDMTHNFATKQDIISSETKSTAEHQRIDTEIEAVKADVAKIQDYIDWGVRIIIGAVLISGLALLGLNA